MTVTKRGSENVNNPQINIINYQRGKKKKKHGRINCRTIPRIQRRL